MSQLDISSQMTFGDVQGLRQWFLEHAIAHQNYARNLALKYKADSPLFDLADQGCMADWGVAMAQGKDGQITQRITNWLLAHNAIHTTELTVTGAAQPIDLTQVDFRDQDQFYDWMANHILLHDIEDQVLS